MTRKLVGNAWVVLGVLTIILVPFVLFEEAVQAFAIPVTAHLSGWAGFVAVAGLLTADVVAPVPSSIVATVAGTAMGFSTGCAATWLGLSLGSVFGYGIGAGVFARWTRPKPSPDAQKSKGLSPATLGAVAATRGVPVLAEAVTLLAGAHRMPFVPFLTVSAIANLGVAAAYAYVGAKAADVNSFLLALGGSIGLPAITLLIHRAISRRRARG